MTLLTTLSFFVNNISEITHNTSVQMVQRLKKNAPIAYADITLF